MINGSNPVKSKLEDWWWTKLRKNAIPSLLFSYLSEKNYWWVENYDVFITICMKITIYVTYHWSANKPVEYEIIKWRSKTNQVFQIETCGVLRFSHTHPSIEKNRIEVKLTISHEWIHDWKFFDSMEQFNRISLAIHKKLTKNEILMPGWIWYTKIMAF